MADELTKILFISGQGRSGSTLLSRFLGSLPNLIEIGEVSYIWERGLIENHLCGCGSPFTECPFWQEVFNVAFGGFAHVDATWMSSVNKQIRRSRNTIKFSTTKDTYGGEYNAFRANMRKLYLAIRHVSGCQIIVDSSKRPTYLFTLRDLDQIQFYALHLVRDSRAVAYSWQRKRRRPEVMGAETHMIQMQPTKVSRMWLMWNVISELSRLFTDVPYIRIYYEKFMKEPVETVVDILSWMGESTIGVDLDSLVDNTLERHTVSGNPMRFQKEIKIKADMEWEAKMNISDRRLVTLMTYPMLLRYGYRKMRSKPLD